MEDRFGTVMRKVTDDIILENRANEVDGIVAENGYKPVDVSGDGGWQTRGRAFDSILGHSILIGKRTNKVVAYRVYARHCVKCEVAEKIGQIPEQHQCPRNYAGSSKGMESMGLLECILDLHNNSGLYVRKFVIDDDTTTKAYARHSYKLLVEEGLMLKDNWPRSDTGLTRKTDYGKLPLSHPQICFEADPNHCVRTYGGALWGLNACSKSETEMTPVDCHRLKRNFAYWLHSGATFSRSEFELRAPSIVLHHFNDHSCCDDSWCIFVSKGKKFAEKTRKYRCRQENKKLFGQLDTMLKKYTTKTRLDEMHHSFSSQKNEALNKAITRYATKSACYSKTKSLNTRIAIAISVNSVGHSAYYDKVFLSIGMGQNKHCSILFRKLDRHTQQTRIRCASARVKRRRAANQTSNWRKEVQKLRYDKLAGKVYKTGIVMASGHGLTIAPPSKKRKQCRCGDTDHSQTTFKSCKLNAKNMAPRIGVESGKATICGLVVGGGVDSMQSTQTDTMGDTINESCQWDSMSFDTIVDKKSTGGSGFGNI